MTWQKLVYKLNLFCSLRTLILCHIYITNPNCSSLGVATLWLWPVCPLAYRRLHWHFTLWHPQNFPFLATKDRYYTKECIHLLLTVIYDHMKYRNVHLQIFTHSSYRGGIVVLFIATLLVRGITVPLFTTLLGGIITTAKEMVLMNTNAYCTPLNKSTDLAKISVSTYLLIVTGFSLLQHKKNTIQMCIHILYM